MKLSTKSRYGLRILMQVAFENIEGKLAQGNLVAKKQGISVAYLEQIMIPLKRAGLVKTVRGCTGGYRLSMAPEDITLLEIIEIFEGSFSLVPCILDKRRCSVKPVCNAHGAWMRIVEKFRESASVVTLKDVIDNKYA